MYVGIPDGVEDRLATLIELEVVARIYDFSFNDMRIRKACIPSSNGHFSARALARMYGALANGGEIDGVRLVSKERIALTQKVLTEAPA